MTAIAEGLTLEETAVAELSAGLRGHLVGRDDPDYDEARKIWNGSIDRRPGLIARCAGVADVISAVKFARTFGLPTAVRSGGGPPPPPRPPPHPLSVEPRPRERVGVESPPPAPAGPAPRAPP